MNRSFAFDSPDQALDSLAERLAVVSESAQVTDPTGLVLAKPIVADRDSPAADVSAMDGYAMRAQDVEIGNPIDVEGESAAGSAPPDAAAGKAIRIFTGAIVPDGYNIVIKREDTVEGDDQITVQSSAGEIRPGMHIRYAGENANAGKPVLQPGTLITAASRATMANFGASEARTFAPVRVAIMTTGDEVGDFSDEPPQPWQLRNSNRASVAAVVNGHRWIDCASITHCLDNRDSLTESLANHLDNHDAVVMTGGVSMGDYDYVPDVVRELGGEIVFHGLPVRPGKPILAAVTRQGKLILGLPGNPVSATIGAHRFLVPCLAKMSGQTAWRRPRPTVRVCNPDAKTIPLHWMKLARWVGDGEVEIVASKGSGDLVSLGQADGYVSVPPNEFGMGPWPWHEF